jgi:long-chain acyl-CoA synthetase
MTTAADIRRQLTGPGGPFEIVTEAVDGVEMKVYSSRFPSLRTVLQFGAAHGDKEFIVHGDDRISYAEFVRRTNSASAHLAADCGVGHGDRVAVLSANNPEWCLTFWATVNLGAILVGLNGWWTTDEIIYGLEDSGAKVLVADGKRLERIVDHLDELPVEVVYVVGDDPAAFGGHPKLRRFDELVADPTDEMPDVDLAEGDPAVIFYTSGTTGRPKGAISTHRNMIANLQNTVFVLTAGQMEMAARAAERGEDPAAASPTPAGQQPVSLFTSPLFHVSGCHSTLVVGMMAGMRLVMPVGRFDPIQAFELIEREGVMIWATVPTMIWRACEHPARHDYDTSSVISVSFGGSPSADELQRKIRETFPNVKATTNAYGLTESSSVATCLTGDDSLTRAESVGQPMPTVDLAIAGPDGEHLPPGRTGEILIKGPIIMAGYWNKPEATAATVRDGWLHTGDVGHLSDDGYLYVTDRAKDMIIRGGENIYCVEIENRLVEHPAIADAAIIGVPHPSLGEEVKAVVQVEDGRSITEDEVRRWVGDALAAFKVPAYVELRSEKLPRNASGKLLKNALRGEGDVSFVETM